MEFSLLDGWLAGEEHTSNTDRLQPERAVLGLTVIGKFPRIIVTCVTAGAAWLALAHHVAAREDSERCNSQPSSLLTSVTCLHARLRLHENAVNMRRGNKNNQSRPESRGSHLQCSKRYRHACAAAPYSERDSGPSIKVTQDRPINRYRRYTSWCVEKRGRNKEQEA